MDEIRTLSIDGPGEVSLVAEEAGEVPEGGLLVHTLYSGVSAGTELTYVKGVNPYLNCGWDPELGLFTDGGRAIRYPVRGIGYMQVGRVVASRTRAVEEGTLVRRRSRGAGQLRGGRVASPLRRAAGRRDPPTLPRTARFAQGITRTASRGP